MEIVKLAANDSTVRRYDHPCRSFATLKPNTATVLPNPSGDAPFFLSFYDVILYRSLATTLLCRGSLSAKRKRQPNDRWQPSLAFSTRGQASKGSPTENVARTFLRRIDARRSTSSTLFTIPAGFLVGVDRHGAEHKNRRRTGVPGWTGPTIVNVARGLGTG